VITLWPANLNLRIPIFIKLFTETGKEPAITEKEPAIISRLQNPANVPQ
jgi:hypothetical protein